ncbi:hypothetical protein BSNK01_18670 [Bacillaceae bacterium]
MLDAIIMEKSGIPSTAILTEPFVHSGKAMAQAHGFPGYPFAVIPHPIAATEREILQKRANEVLPDVVRLLLKPQA